MHAFTLEISEFGAAMVFALLYNSNLIHLFYSFICHGHQIFKIINVISHRYP